MSEQLFTREGKPETPNAEFKGRPALSFIGQCGRCLGSGSYSFNLMDGDKCYGCQGAGRRRYTAPLYTAPELARLDRAAQRRRESRERAAEAARQQAQKDAADAQAALQRQVVELQAQHAETFTQLDWLVEDERLQSALREEPLVWWRDARLNVLSTGRLPQGLIDLIARRYSEGVARQAARRQAISAGHIGQPKERLKVAATVAEVRHISTVSRYPLIERWLVTLHTEAGHVLSWWTSNPSCQIGDTVSAFTVKAHESYKGLPQTIILRPTFA